MNWLALTAFLVVACTESSPTSPHVPRTEIGDRVNMSNIDPSSETGADRLLRRIRDAAVTSCDIDRTPSAESALARQVCMRAAMAEDVARVENPILLARFRRLGAIMISPA